MNMRLKKIVVGVTLATGAGAVAWASCGGTEGMVAGSAGSLAASATAGLSAAATRLIALDEVQTEAILSAVRVMVKQIEASAEKASATIIASEQAQAAFGKKLLDDEMIDKIVLDYTSQGYDPCGQSAATKNLAMTEAQVNASIPGLARSEVDAGGGKFGSPSDVLRAREERHRSLFCTQAEVDSGLCSSVGKIPGGDTNAALLFGTDASSEARAAKNALINNVIGLPNAPVPPEAAGTPQATGYLLEAKKRDAFLSFPAYSLKTIQAENENFKVVMDGRVGQYFGTPQAAKWAASQTSQSSRGLLVDLVKIQGINLKIAERRLKQNMRIEANLAALLEVENQARNSGVTGQYARQAATTAAAARQKVSN